MDKSIYQVTIRVCYTSSGTHTNSNEEVKSNTQLFPARELRLSVLLSLHVQHEFMFVTTFGTLMNPNRDLKGKSYGKLAEAV